MISSLELKIALRYLRPKKKEGFLKIISVFSFGGIALGVSVLIIVMSVMGGFRTELINKIIGFNPHIIIKPYNKRILPILEEANPDLFICGHSHILKVMYDKKNQLLHMNPGAIGDYGIHKVKTILCFTIEGKEIKNLRVVEFPRSKN